MRRATLYSRATPSRPGARLTRGEPAAGAGQIAEGPSAAVAGHPPGSRLRRFLGRHQRPLLVAAGGLLALALVLVHAGYTPAPRQITQHDIDAAVLRTLETKPLPSRAAKAYEVIRPSVVRVRGFGVRDGEEEEVETGVGSGVVIVDKGIILTNLHVVVGAKRVGVVFSDGLESEATLVGVYPEHDLAVLQAKTIPDDLFAATMRSTQDLALDRKSVV